MKFLYVDSSIMVAMMFEEKGSEAFKKRLQVSVGAFSSYLMEAEIYSAARREGVPLEYPEQFLQTVSLVFPNRSLKKEYEKIFSKQFCRGADACHIATALFLDPEGKSLGFLTADRVQAEIARKIGLKVIP